MATVLHPELDRLTAEAVRLAGEYERRLNALNRHRFMPPTAPGADYSAAEKRAVARRGGGGCRGR